MNFEVYGPFELKDSDEVGVFSGTKLNHSIKI